MTEADHTVVLTQRIRASKETGAFVDDVLRTDERVLARITDGIYRQPASALRELIANAYDADATSVVIDCDPPRFSRITVRDNGSGMSDETLAHVIHHIGGSLKRTRRGSELSVAAEHDPQLSPGGRKLIGRIGIGLFSIVQLTPHFQIITKVKGSAHRIVADIIMAAETIEQAAQRAGSEQLTTGRVRIWLEPAVDTDSHGTDIVLLDVRPQTKEMLRSTARWQSLRKDPDLLPQDWLPTSATAPTFHIGGLSFENDEIVETPAALPWAASDSSSDRFRKLVEGVRAQTRSVTNTELRDVLDNYFQMIWTLSLGLPAPYVNGHPFDADPSQLDMYWLSNEKKGQPRKVDGWPRGALSISAPSGFEDDNFSITVDGVTLARPIEVRRADISTSTAIKKDLIFYGSCSPDLSGVAEEFRGGPLTFEAYVYWTPKVVPKDHNGVLVRIKGASGTLFDPTFLGYQVAENTRLKQITAEIFVKEGLEGALNIDRESFNYANIHYQFLSRWLHGAIRQVANRHKAVSKESTTDRRRGQQTRLASALDAFAAQVWLERTQNADEEPPFVNFIDQPTDVTFADGVTVQRSALYVETTPAQRRYGVEDIEPRVRAIYQILYSYGLLESLDYKAQQSLILDIARVLRMEVPGNG